MIDHPRTGSIGRTALGRFGAATIILALLTAALFAAPGEPRSWAESVANATQTAVRAMSGVLAAQSSSGMTPTSSQTGTTSSSTSGAGALPPGWVPQTIAGKVRFAYPAYFVPNNDGAPHFVLVGGGILNAAKSNFQLLLGVAVDTTPGISVGSAATQFVNEYGKKLLLVQRQTPYGQELSFDFPGGMTYTLYLSPLRNGVREIIVNNEQSDPTYQALINTFLGTVKTLS